MSKSEKPSTLFRIVHSGIMSAGMSFLVVLVVSATNIGLTEHLLPKFLKAWSISYPVAWIAAFFWGPVAIRLSQILLKFRAR